jgi:2-methylisocitrate lyase-like PEP mutase family enzyme
VEGLSKLGVKRISVGGALSRAALGEFLRAAKEMKDAGTFSFVKQAVSHKEISELFQD